MNRTIGVIIPARNEEPLIARAVQSSWRARADEVWVIDGQSTDQTAARASDAGAHVVTSPACRAVQMNCGAHHCQSEVLVFLHADCWLHPSALDQLRHAAAGDNVVFGAFRQRIDSPGIIFRWLEWGNAARVRWWGVPYGDQAIFVDKNTFHKVGGFPEQPLLEDLLLACRLRRWIWPILLDGPLYVSARRWQRYGAVRQTLRNWSILAAWALGAHPARLARFYRRHDA